MIRIVGVAFLILAVGGRLPAADSPLADAVERQDQGAIRALLKKQVDVNSPQPDGMTALHWAVYRDDIETVRRLARADVNATNRYGVAPLSLACRNGSAPIVALLLDRGADPNFALRGGETPLMTAARTGNGDVVTLLLKKGAEINSRERRGQTALMWGAAEGNASVVKLLLEAGADYHTAVPDTGFTAFFFAAREGRIDAVRALLRAGADVNESMQPARPVHKGPAKGTSALILAVENGHFDLAVELLQAGADPNDQRAGFTPLHVLTWVRKPQRGEDEGDPPPRGSGNRSSLEFVRALVARGADVNCQLKKGAGGPGLFNKLGATPFLMAAATADVPYMRLLAELGANPNLSNVDQCTPLMAACGIGVGSAAANETAGEEPEVLEAAEWLLQHGADINAVDKNGETAMHGAAYKNLPQVVKFLAGHGAKPEIWNRPNRWGWTPLAIAEGHRPGNFKPSVETAEAIREALRLAKVLAGQDK